MQEMDLMTLVLTASPVVQAVMLILALMSVAVWAIAFAKSNELRKSRLQAEQFEANFWGSQELTNLFKEVESNRDTHKGLSLIFADGFREFIRLQNQGVTNTTDLVSASQRAIKIAFSRENDRLEKHLNFLATVGSSAPYIGLFGTVWGVMHAFQSLGNVQHATLAAVAPGISEALIATAIGLFAAIPAVIAYNRLSNRVDLLMNEYENFADNFLTILQRQAHLYDKKA